MPERAPTEPDVYGRDVAPLKLTKTSLSYLGIGGLALLTAGVSIAALTQDGTPPTSATPSPAVVTPSTDTAVASPSPSAPREGLAGVADLINSPDGASILVIGDGSGDEDDEWVSVWAREHLAKDAVVSYRAWDRANNQYGPVVRSGSAGPTIDVWNASVRSPDMTQEPDRIARAWQDADVVLFSYGHRRTPGQVPGRMDAVLAAVRANDEDVKVVTLLQNPGRAATEIVRRETVQAMRIWADAHTFPTVDIFAAFMADPTPRNDLVESDGSPTPQGSALWALTLADALNRAMGE